MFTLFDLKKKTDPVSKPITINYIFISFFKVVLLNIPS